MTPKQIVTLAGSFAAALLTLIVVMSTLYTVDEREYALQLRFGEVKEVRTTPGLYIKMPFFDAIQRIDKRTLRANIPSREVPDKDKERLIVDIIVRYKIDDPLQFRKTLRNEATARERLQAITYSAMRDTIGIHDRTEIIGAHAILDDDGKPVNDDEGLPIYESLLGTRDAISQQIQDRINHTVTDQQYGIQIISANIKRADFPLQIRSSIIDRLWAERRRIAARHRADGEEEYRKRTAAVQAEADIIIAEANRDARQTRGKGDAEAIRLVQEALTKDPEFYTFLRTLESYETSINNGATLIITGQTGGYLDTLISGPPSRNRAANPIPFAPGPTTATAAEPGPSQNQRGKQ